MSRPEHPAVLVLAHTVSGAERGRDLMVHRADAVVVRSGAGRAGIRRGLRAVLGRRWGVVYLLDVGMSTSVASLVARATGARVLVDTGDVGFALARSKGSAGGLRLAVIWLGEQAALRAAHGIIIRGRAHAEMLPVGKPVHHIPDIPPAEARPLPGDEMRRRLDLDGRFVIGLVGSINWAPRLGTSYGWEIVEALALLPEDHAALIVGDGDGLDRLKARAEALGVAYRCRFAGRLPRETVSEWIGAMDVAVSTQTNDAVGAVRTTGKLPLYLACGRPVIATHVGEAASLLGPLGWTLPYEGTVDRGYPQRLAEAVRAWPRDASTIRRREQLAAELAGEAFNREGWATVADVLITQLLAGRGPVGPSIHSPPAHG